MHKIYTLKKIDSHNLGHFAVIVEGNTIGQINKTRRGYALRTADGSLIRETFVSRETAIGLLISEVK